MNSLLAVCLFFFFYIHRFFLSLLTDMSRSFTAIQLDRIHFIQNLTFFSSRISHSFARVWKLGLTTAKTISPIQIKVKLLRLYPALNRRNKETSKCWEIYAYSKGKYLTAYLLYTIMSIQDKAIMALHHFLFLVALSKVCIPLCPFSAIHSPKLSR